MKIHRSSKNLKPVDPQLKQQCQLRMKVKLLQQQVSLLQKSNLNIFIPISQHHQSPDYQSIITKLRQQILTLQQQSTSLKNQIKKCEKQKQQQKNKYQKQIRQQGQKIRELKQHNQEMKIQINQLQNKYEAEVEKCRELDRKLIQKNVELKFVNQDLCEERVRRNNMEKQLKDIKDRISEVIHGSKVYKSAQIKYICLQKSQYDSLKAKIAQLQAKIRAMMQANKPEKIVYGTKKQDIGEQIVRLKKNIDLQLGIQQKCKHSQQFLKAYRGTQDLFTQLIKKCQT